MVLFTFFLELTLYLCEILLCPGGVKQNTAGTLCVGLSLNKTWTWWSVYVLAAPKAAWTLQDDLSITVLEENEKEEERQGGRRERWRGKSNTGSNKDPAPGPGISDHVGLQSGLAARHSSAQTEDLRFVCKTPRALPWFPKGQIAACSRNTPLPCLWE